MQNNIELWNKTLVEISDYVSKPNFSTWFGNTFISKHDGNTVFLCVPNAFAKDWLSTKYHKDILRALRSNLNTVRTIEYVVSKNHDIAPEPEPQVTTLNQPVLDEFGIGGDGLNSRYVFDSFIVGPFNELANAAAQAVIKNPGMSYNPLFIYGGTGLGKTHLIQSIGNHIKKQGSDKRVIYITSEKFTLEYIESVQNNKMHIFKDKYRSYDLFVMDDVQFISGKEKTQEELFHLFNNLYENNKQIVFSSDKAPKYIPKLEERLRSRFEGGMIADIEKPDFESRLAILRTKSSQNSFNLPDDLLEFVASIVQDNIRELEGVLNSVICQSQLKKRPLSLSEVKLLIKNSIQPQRSLTIKEVIQTVSEFYNVSERLLYEKTRKKEIVKPRQIVMYLLRESLNTSYPHIGEKLGGRDHTTVIHACEKIKRDLQDNSILNQEIEQIKKTLYNKTPYAVV